MGTTNLSIRVTPRASRTVIVGFVGEVLHIRLSEPPVDDAANKACCALIAGELRLPKSAVTVVKGLKSRDKVLRIDGVIATLPWGAAPQTQPGSSAQ